MKVVVGPLRSFWMKITSNFNKVSEEDHKEYVQKTILDMHQLCTEAITRCVIMHKVGTFEAKRFIEYYYKICDIQNNFIKTGKIEPLRLIDLKRELNEYYKRCFKE